TSPGSYFLARDITVISGNVIRIQASEVTIDLNGKTIRATAPAPIPPPPEGLIAIDTGASTVRVRNGQLVGGVAGILAIGGAGPILVDVENVAFNQGYEGIQIAIAGEIAISRCSFRNVTNNAVEISAGSLPTAAARIAGNVFSSVGNRAISVNNVRSVEVVDN